MKPESLKFQICHITESMNFVNKPWLCMQSKNSGEKNIFTENMTNNLQKKCKYIRKTK